MTLDEAAAEAARRWGERGYVAVEAGETERLLVGRLDVGALGRGATWGEAFEDATETEREAAP